MFREQQRRACLTLLSLLGGESSGSIDALALWSPPAPRGSRAEREEEEARKLAVAHTLQRCSGVKALVHVLRCAYTDVSVEAAIALRPARERRAAHRFTRHNSPASSCSALSSSSYADALRTLLPSSSELPRAPLMPTSSPRFTSSEALVPRSRVALVEANRDSLVRPASSKARHAHTPLPSSH